MAEGRTNRRRTPEPEPRDALPRDQPAEPTAAGPPDATADQPAESRAERRRRRAAFLRELTEAKELRARVSPRRTRAARIREALRRATYRNP